MYADTYVITGKTVNVRATPDMNGRVVGKLHKDDRITVTGMYDSNWAEIQHHYRKRYVSRKYIAFAGRDEEEWSMEDLGTERISTWWAIIRDHFWWGGFLLFIVVIFPIIQKKRTEQ
jgi:hypothetical protein